MRPSEFDRINAALDRVEFALEELRKRASELCRKLAAAKTPEETEALNIEAIELKRQLGKISESDVRGQWRPFRLATKWQTSRRFGFGPIGDVSCILATLAASTEVL
jgi:hypothetical protein